MPSSIPCDTEVTDFHLLITSQKGISRLQISVDDVVFVKKLLIVHAVIHNRIYQYTTTTVTIVTHVESLLLLLLLLYWYTTTDDDNDNDVAYIQGGTKIWHRFFSVRLLDAFTLRYYGVRGIAMASRLSVGPSVTLRYRAWSHRLDFSENSLWLISSRPLSRMGRCPIPLKLAAYHSFTPPPLPRVPTVTSLDPPLKQRRQYFAIPVLLGL